MLAMTAKLMARQAIFAILTTVALSAFGFSAPNEVLRPASNPCAQILTPATNLSQLPTAEQVVTLIALKDVEHRNSEEKEFLSAYKNDFEFVTWLRQLPHSFNPFDVGELLRRFKKARPNPVGQPKTEIIDLGTLDSTADYLKVAMLRAGDTIIIDGVQFRLGLFLGTGNATHVFELVDYPSDVLRIPFTTGRLKNPLASDVEKVSDPKKRLEHYYKKEISLPAEISHTAIHEVGKTFAFARVDKVDGTLNGRDLLNRLSKVRFFSMFTTSRTDLIKYQRLLREIEIIDPLAEKTGTLEQEARQFVWDDHLQEWILVDWE